jgi:hypothetical protein
MSPTTPTNILGLVAELEQLWNLAWYVTINVEAQMYLKVNSWF